jgi:hypothetical protein
LTRKDVKLLPVQHGAVPGQSYSECHTGICCLLRLWFILLCYCYDAFGTLLSTGRKWNLRVVVYLVKRCVTVQRPCYIYVAFFIEQWKRLKTGRDVLGTYRTKDSADLHSHLTLRVVLGKHWKVLAVPFSQSVAWGVRRIDFMVILNILTATPYGLQGVGNPS